MESVSTTQLAAEYPTLAALPREDLVALADADASAPNEALLEATVRTLPNVSEEDDEHLALLEQVEHAAARNEARRSELETLRDETRRAFVYARTLETQWPGVERALREANKVMDAKTMIYQILTMYTALYTIRDAVTLAASCESAARGERRTGKLLCRGSFSD
ncbi:hypothetical protein MGL_1411 [Malassezia globosa CBS 7966]|uniref:Uncharacterized protein n=1 Tax=Malassezia globosa (strain ATCC MYA-4612 / CBS 7966) TaxID=425265 RepID=A8PXD5_MALGO|nr:uncharacterized protein MGL_1411 [Malassezia globosa CBS 7966]EDP44014.1 hypothetical protein MGL_1411 [Malassezia globosa CBS 7966]